MFAWHFVRKTVEITEKCIKMMCAVRKMRQFTDNRLKLMRVYRHKLERQTVKALDGAAAFQNEYLQVRGLVVCTVKYRFLQTALCS